MGVTWAWNLPHRPSKGDKILWAETTALIETAKKNKVCGIRLSIETPVRPGQRPSASSPKLAIILDFLDAACPYI